jgi:group I intron endonuclease
MQDGLLGCRAPEREDEKVVVYLITNLVNGKRYVGQTTRTTQQRFKHHCWRSTVRTRMPIAMAIAKYGAINFKIEVICSCSSQEELDRMELHYATQLGTFSPNGYNLRAGNGTGSVSAETRAKLSAKMTGKTATPETRAKLSKSHMGIRLSEDAKRKLSEANRGKPGTTYCYQRSSEVSAKTYVLYSPDGRKTTIHNMRKFCKDHDLSPARMCEVVRGRKLHHKGWTLDPLLHVIAAEKRKGYKTNRYFFNDHGRRFSEGRCEVPLATYPASSDQPISQ